MSPSTSDVSDFGSGNVFLPIKSAWKMYCGILLRIASNMTGKTRDSINAQDARPGTPRAVGLSV